MAGTMMYRLPVAATALQMHYADDGLKPYAAVRNRQRNGGPVDYVFAHGSTGRGRYERVRGCLPTVVSCR